MAAHEAPPSLGFSRQEHWSGLPFPSPMQESEKWKWSHSVLSDSSRPHGLQPTRLLRPWDFPGKSTGVGCHCLLQCIWWHLTKSLNLSYLPIEFSLWHGNFPKSNSNIGCGEKEYIKPCKLLLCHKELCIQLKKQLCNFLFYCKNPTLISRIL